MSHDSRHSTNEAMITAKRRTCTVRPRISGILWACVVCNTCVILDESEAVSSTKVSMGELFARKGIPFEIKPAGARKRWMIAYAIQAVTPVPFSTYYPS